MVKQALFMQEFRSNWTVIYGDSEYKFEDEKAGYLYRLIVDGYNWSQPAFEYLIKNIQDNYDM